MEKAQHLGGRIAQIPFCPSLSPQSCLHSTPRKPPIGYLSKEGTYSCGPPGCKWFIPIRSPNIIISLSIFETESRKGTRQGSERPVASWTPELSPIFANQVTPGTLR